MALHDDYTDADPALRSALQRVADADHRLLETADAAGQKARTRLNEAAVAIALGAAIALLVGGASGRRRLASSLLTMAVPAVGALVAQLFHKQKKLEEKQEHQEAVLEWQGEANALPATPTSVPPVS